MKISKIHRWLLAAGLVIGSSGIASANRPDAEQTGQRQGQTTQWQQQRQQQQQQPSGQMKVVRGRVLATKSVQIRGTNERNTVALIRTQDGKRKIVDLGPRADATALGLEVGDQLTVRGKQVNLAGRQVFIAKQARTADNRLNIDRSSQRRQFDRQMRRAQRQMTPSEEG